MKTIMVAILAVLALQGCASDIIPSLKYCQHVEYQRDGIDSTLIAQCRVPAG